MEHEKKSGINFWIFGIGFAALPLLNGGLQRHHLVGNTVRFLLIGLAAAMVGIVASLPVFAQPQPTGARRFLLVIAAATLAAACSCIDSLLQ